jgi:hypothetical protein
MPYLNIDDGFPDHQKVDHLSDGAFRLHVSALAYCAKHTTDGRIPAQRVSRLTPNYKPGHLSELLRGKVWHKGGDGCGTDTCPEGDPGEYVAHDYLEWNQSAEWWADRRRREAERKADYRAKKAAEERRLAELEEQARRNGLRSV